jgi:hypothetical protein
MKKSNIKLSDRSRARLESMSRGTNIDPDEMLELIRKYYPDVYKSLVRSR